jgi:hypothetical protein
MIVLVTGVVARLNPAKYSEKIVLSLSTDHSSAWCSLIIKRSRARCSINWPCCSTDLICTKRMVGRALGGQAS